MALHTANVADHIAQSLVDKSEPYSPSIFATPFRKRTWHSAKQVNGSKRLQD